MKKINAMIIGFFLMYTALLLAAGIVLKGQTGEKDKEYLVEVNRIMQGMEEQGSFSVPDLSGMEKVTGVSFMECAELTRADAGALEDAKAFFRVDAGALEDTKAFFRAENGTQVHIEPLVISGRLLGFIRFNYKNTVDLNREIIWIEGLTALAGILVLTILIFIRNKIIKPFSDLSSLPYEMSRGRMDAEILENKDRFLGKFVWGISMLRDHLKEAQKKSLRLEREKKLLLLSISHDIKTPLSTIKLYARALEEGLYDTKEKQADAARQIEKQSGEIENFVKEIVRSSSEEIVHVEVENAEFYLKDLVKLMEEYYLPKCRLFMIEFSIGAYENKLLRGSCDSVFEAVENIMENAFKYGDGKRIDITFYEEDYCQIIKVANTGRPVEMEELPHLFDSFYRGSNAGDKEGNGLGLYICREIMQKMEGEIFAHREKEGMSFHLVLPLSQA